MSKKLKIIKKRLVLGSITLLCALTSCVHNKQGTTLSKSTQTHVNMNTATHIAPQNPQAHKQNKEQHTITIWIHGTRTRFIHYYLLKNLLYRKPGLIHASKYLKKYNLRKIYETLTNKKNSRFNRHFYAFGWNGILSHEKRSQAAKELHVSLLQLVNTYKDKHGVTPQIRFITHSHGGNVALCFAKINDNSQEQIKISELILLACPVQVKTAHLIKSKTFEKIFSISSALDIIQVLDPQGLHDFRKTIRNRTKKPFFSKRVFPPQANLTQIKVKINRRAILHAEFITQKFINLFPSVLEEIDNWNTQEENNPNSYKTVKLLKIKDKYDTLCFNRKTLRIIKKNV